MSPRRDTPRHAATSDAPEEGVLRFGGVPVFAVDHWVEGDEHVFRSKEFPLTVGDPDITRAVDRFVESAEDMWGFLEEQDHLTGNELELVSLLAQRFRRMLRVLLEREEQRHEELRSWQPGSPIAAHCSQPLPA
jgi:hypothetical protein